MLSILWIAGIIAGFIFPSFLIKAIRSNDEEEVLKNIILACISFGIIVLEISLLLAYS